MIIVRVLIFIVICASGAVAQTNAGIPATLERATQQYAKAILLMDEDPDAARDLFADAAIAFERSHEDGHENAELFRAQGNAWYFAGDVGRAIVAYRRGLTRHPGDLYTLDALSQARQAVRTSTARESRSSLVDVLTDWHQYVSPLVVQVVFAISWILFWCLLVRARVGGHRPPTMILVVTVATIGMTATALLAERWRLAKATPVVLIDEATGMNGPSSAVYQPSFDSPLTPGVEALEIESRFGWTHIELPSGLQTWVPEDSLMWIHPRNP